jgi:hypothetical protein
MPWTVDPPTYNHRYGYNDGAQDDIFIAAPSEPSPSSSATSARPSGTASVSGLSTATPTTSIPSSAGQGMGVGYRIPRMSSLSQ